MSYTPNTWATGDTITASKLNNMEQGIANAGGGGVLVVNAEFSGSTYTLDHTWQEIYNALSSGTPAYLLWAFGEDEVSMNLLSVYAENGTYYVYDVISKGDFTTNSKTGYPVG